MVYKVCILGGGCWGIALSCLLLNKKCKVKVYEPVYEKYRKLCSSRYLETLPQVARIPEEIEITNDIQYSVEDSEIIIFALPSVVVRKYASKVKSFVNNDKVRVIISATKGIETETFMRMSEVISQELGLSEKIAALSGPTHAEEVCQQNIPTACVVAGVNKEVALFAQQLLFTEHFRVYTNDDIIGVELGGALKNIYAIAAGICDGLKLGDNTKAALVTRALAELTRFGTRLGGKLTTFLGLAGVGDLIVTCYSSHSRNNNFGKKLAQGLSTQQALQEINMTVEGVITVKAVHNYCSRNELDVEMPIAEEVYKVVYEGKSVRDALKSLIHRSPKHEFYE
jgi:glycerol-3-phosphate dehydrogenase (NAD(P)+)